MGFLEKVACDRCGQEVSVEEALDWLRVGPAIQVDVNSTAFGQRWRGDDTILCSAACLQEFANTCKG